MLVATVELRADTQCNNSIVDSGASRHMTFENNVLYDYKDFEAPEPVGFGDGRAIGVGKANVIAQLHNGRSVVCWITECYMFPNLPTICLVYVHAATIKGITVSFRSAAFGVKTGRSLLLDLPWAALQA